jgi:hypothetical protein
MGKGILGTFLASFAFAGLTLAQTPGVLPERSLSAGPASAVAPPSVTARNKDIDSTPSSAGDVIGHGACADADSSRGNGSGPADRVWGSAEVLLWWIKPGNVPPLATTGSLDSGGAIGPGTTTLLGGSQGDEMRVGGRFSVGYWLDCHQSRGIEASYFFLNGPADRFDSSSAGAPGSAVLARPFFNVISGLQDAQAVAFPGVTGGNLRTFSNSQLQGAQLNGVGNLCCHSSCCNDCCANSCCDQSGYRVNLIGGFRYLQLNEDLRITENLTLLPTAPPPFVPGQTINVVDRFETRNNFYGGQIGARGEWWRGRWFVNALGTVALGDTHQEVRISGSTTFTDPGFAPVRQSGGLLALPTNIGSYSRDQFSVVPEVGINVGRQLTDHVRVYAGYSFIYWSSVVRPGDQIDFGVNPTQLPTVAGAGTLVGPARPAFAFQVLS